MRSKSARRVSRRENLTQFSPSRRGDDDDAGAAREPLEKSCGQIAKMVRISCAIFTQPRHFWRNIWTQKVFRDLLLTACSEILGSFKISSHILSLSLSLSLSLTRDTYKLLYHS